MGLINLPTTNRSPIIKFGFTSLAVIPLCAWIISILYIPMFSEHLSQAENWAVTLTILLLMGGSLFCHIAAHLYAARIRQDKKPKELAIFIFGDAAQSWPLAASAGNEMLIASAGPLSNILLSGLAYLLWYKQTNIFLDLIALFICVFNGWLFIINLLPAFPMDGGRIMRAGFRGFSSSSSSVTILIRRFGFIIALALIGWGGILYIQNPNFGPQTALFTFPLVILLMDGLRIRPGVEEDAAANGKSDIKFRWLRLPGFILLALIMLGIFSSTLMTDSGLEVPGAGIPVEPMVNVPSQYRFHHTGTFILTTLSTHAPIFVGEWMQAQIDPTKLIVAPKKTTSQEQARQDYQLLEDSEATAITVGLKRAGFPSEMIGKGARVDTIWQGGRANGILLTGDVITSVNGTPIRSTDDFWEKISALSGNSSVQLAVERGQVKMDLTVPLLQPGSPSDTPKIGITTESAGFDLHSPFPVSITTQEISGGSSAGLMFTLTIYNSLSAQDLTGGRKIAGTGTINPDGTVGSIGGVKQKVIAAEAAGASYFLCPVDNYADAVSMARTIKVIKVASVQDALDFLHSLPPK